MDLLKGRTDNTAIQLFRYTVAGGLVFVLDFAALFVLTEYAHIHYLVSAVIAFCLAVVASYCASVCWVFKDRALNNSPMAELSVFALLAISGLILSWLLLYSFTELVGFHYLISKVIATGVTYVWNFVSKKIILFPSRSKAGAKGIDAEAGYVMSDIGLVEQA